MPVLESHLTRCLSRTVVLMALCLAGLTAVARAQAPNTTGVAPVSDEGRVLAARLDASGVDHLWIAGHRINWKTGEAVAGTAGHTHCSAFVASFAEGLGIYILRPPQHGQDLLASAQVVWLGSDEARRDGWRKVDGMFQAQSLANQGHFVVVAFPSPIPNRPGHIAIVRPSSKSEAQLKAEGPDITQAGQENFLSTTVRAGFRHHKGAWPDGVVYYVHK